MLKHVKAKKDLRLYEKQQEEIKLFILNYGLLTEDEHFVNFTIDDDYVYIDYLVFLEDGYKLTNKSFPITFLLAKDEEELKVLKQKEEERLERIERELKKEEEEELKQKELAELKRLQEKYKGEF